MSNSDPASPGARSYNYSIRTLGTEPPPQRRLADLFLPACLVLVALFLGWGLLFLPMLGFQADEVVFVYDFWHPGNALATLGFHHHALPTMITSYAGAFKSWLYLPVFEDFGYSAYAIRMPMLLLSALTILLAGRLFRRIGGTAAALVGVALLSTDVVFLVTSVFDWGPVAIQNFLLVLGLVLALRWYDTGKDRYAFLLGCCYGLALWDKALFLWSLSGLVIALLCLALPTLIRIWRWKAAALLVAGLCLGAAPLLKYNLQSHGGTLKNTSHVSLSAMGDKAWYFSFAINGEAAPAATIDLTNGNRDQVHRIFSSAATAIADRIGPEPSSWRFPVCLIAILLGLFIADTNRRKWILFFVISGFLGWLQSAITPDAGRSIHHTVLFWINWYAATALAFATLATWRPPAARRIVVGVTAILSLLGTLTIANDYGELVQHSASTPWSDADAALATKLSSIGANAAVTADWGIADVLVLRTRNQLPVTQEEFKLNTGIFDPDTFLGCQAPNCYVVTHVPEKLILPQAQSTLNQSFAAGGFIQKTTATINDTHGTPTFLIIAVTPGAATRTTEAHPGSLPAITVSSTPKLLATPDVIVTKGEVGRTTLTWQVPSSLPVEIHVGAPDGPLFVASKGPGQATTGYWVKNGTQFFLQDVSSGKERTPENTVARVTVAVQSQ